MHFRSPLRKRGMKLLTVLSLAYAAGYEGKFVSAARLTAAVSGREAAGSLLLRQQK